MTIPEICTFLHNKLDAITERKRVAAQNGDIDQLAFLERDEASTNASLAILQALPE